MSTAILAVLSAVALSVGACAQESTRPLAAASELLPPVRLEAGGEAIDTGKCIAHSGPHLLDLDEDGKRDLLVGDFDGHIHFFKNTGTNAAPVYAAGQTLEVNGKVIEIPNW
ncbi:MAG: hypothetical protein AB1486_13715 [Planctomycetota bacterium]